jgi:transposase
MLDVTAYSEFISEHHITKGIVVADKGFPQSAAKRHFKENPDLHYLNPLKRDSKIASELHMLEFTGQLCGYEGTTFRKEKASDARWLYSFRDAYRAAKEESDWRGRSGKKNDYCLADLQKARAVFGTVFLECDMDIEPETIYKAYSKRWEIEIVMRFYKAALEFDETRVHDDYSVIGSEFCNFLSSVLTFRMIRAFDKAKLLEQMPYKKIMKILARAKMFNEPGYGWRLIRINPSYEEILKRLDIHPTEKLQPKRKRGRPPKNKNV